MIIYTDGKAVYWLEGYPNEVGNEKYKRIISAESKNAVMEKYDYSDYLQMLAHGRLLKG